MNREVVLRFRSSNGNEYLYDDVTGHILNWSDIHDEVLNLMHKGELPQNIINNFKDIRNIDKIVKEIEFWYKVNGAFFREDIEQKSLEHTEEFEALVTNEVSQLMLSVTDNCNLSCKYCIFSDNYFLTKTNTNNYMTKETAKKSIDYFYSIVSKQFITNPKKDFAFTFYGGEPLMNFEVIKFSINYIKEIFKNKKYIFSLTTNGLLLNEEIVSFLAENKVTLAISIDGDQEEHDKRRVTRGGNGSFKTILNNLNMIREKYPNYFNTQIGITSVFDLNTDLKKADTFFENGEISKIIPGHLFTNMVSNVNTQYYDQFDKTDSQYFEENIDFLENKYNDKLKRREECSTYLLSLIGPKFNRIAVRERFHDIRGNILPSTGTCMIGRKIHIGWNGNIDICEKVNGKNPIGDLNNGLDFKKIVEYINKYKEEIVSKCNGCSIQKFCPFCFMHFESDNTFKHNMSRCKQEKEFIIKTLSKYTTILEENPSIEFDFLEDALRVSEFQLIYS
ncbi:radical SAM protein [Clostridium subterminale]|uniref:Radical SAM protein n=1 Tax=Clostridium subterminale TaxID=1550 RepID=A0ABP3W5L6_CLOSU